MWVTIALAICSLSYVILNKKISNEHKTGFCAVVGILVSLGLIFY